jgi:lysophospholipase L1-like esterase
MTAPFPFRNFIKHPFCVFSVQSLLPALFGLALAPLVIAADAPQQSFPTTVFKNLNDGKPQTVLVYGTSLTAASEWPKALKAYFEKQYPGKVTFINSAQSGETSVWGVANLQDKVLSKNPDLVFLEFSVNDAATKHNISIEKSAQNLHAMVSLLQAQNPQVDIILQTMNSAWDSPDQLEHKKFASDRPHLADYYDAYRNYAQVHHLPLIDHYPNWLKLQQTNEAQFKKWLPDGLHPVPEASLAVTWPAIQTLFEKARSAAGL